MAIFSVVLALILVNLLKAQGTPVTPVLEETSGEQSSDLNMQTSSEFPVEYSGDPYKEEDMEQTGNTGVQEGEQATWETSGEPSTETTPNSNMSQTKIQLRSQLLKYLNKLQHYIQMEKQQPFLPAELISPLKTI
uniref:Proximal barbule cell factor n=1 Tax=Coturnix japonica TaxID=93934 RepID=A0A224ATI0_COTJA|nr:proximal barbule cell factor [Coturnix japonica]